MNTGCCEPGDFQLLGLHMVYCGLEDPAIMSVFQATRRRKAGEAVVCSLPDESALSKELSSKSPYPGTSACFSLAAFIHKEGWEIQCFKLLLPRPYYPIIRELG